MTSSNNLFAVSNIFDPAGPRGIVTALSAAIATADLLKTTASAVNVDLLLLQSASHSARASQRAMAACLAISLRSSGESFAALALPPLIPPSRPSSTAAGFLGRACLLAPVDLSALRDCSRPPEPFEGMLERLGIHQLYAGWS